MRGLRTAGPMPSSVEIPPEGFCLDKTLSAFEQALISKALEKANGVKHKAAQLLGIKPTLIEN